MRDLCGILGLFLNIGILCTFFFQIVLFWAKTLCVTSFVFVVFKFCYQKDIHFLLPQKRETQDKTIARSMSEWSSNVEALDKYVKIINPKNMYIYFFVIKMGNGS